jgi:hypothetical protein
MLLSFDGSTAKKSEHLGVPAIKQVKSKGIAYFLGYVFFDEQIQGLLGFETMN